MGRVYLTGAAGRRTGRADSWNCGRQRGAREPSSAAASADARGSFMNGRTQDLSWASAQNLRATRRWTQEREQTRYGGTPGDRRGARRELFDSASPGGGGTVDWTPNAVGRVPSREQLLRQRLEPYSFQARNAYGW